MGTPAVSAVRVGSDAVEFCGSSSFRSRRVACSSVDFLAGQVKTLQELT